MTAFDMTESIAPRSDQINAEDLLAGPRTVTVKEVRQGTAEQPVEVWLVEFPDRPFKPSKTVRRIMVAAWGPDTSVHAGRRMTLYRDPSVRFGKDEVGGIRVSHMSHLANPLTIALTVTRGRRAPFTVQPLKEEPRRDPDTAQRAQGALTAFAGLGITEQQLADHVGRAPSAWTPQDFAALEALYGQLQRGETTVAEVTGGLQSSDTSPASPPPAPTTGTPAATSPDAAATATQGTNQGAGASGAPTGGRQRRDPSFITQQQQGKIRVLCQDMGHGDREDRLGVLSQILGREIGSSSELTKFEAGEVIDTLIPIAAAEDSATAWREHLANARRLRAGAAGGEQAELGQ